MKLYRFTATNAHRAILTVQESLGPNALIYSTRKVQDGVEVLAGMPLDKEDEAKEVKASQAVQIEKALPAKPKNQAGVFDYKIYDNLCAQLDSMNESIQLLTNSVSLLQQVLVQQNNNKFKINWQALGQIPFLIKQIPGFVKQLPVYIKKSPVLFKKYCRFRVVRVGAYDQQSIK